MFVHFEHRQKMVYEGWAGYSLIRPGLDGVHCCVDFYWRTLWMDKNWYHWYILPDVYDPSEWLCFVWISKGLWRISIMSSISCVLCNKESSLTCLPKSHDMFIVGRSKRGGT